MGRPNQ